MKILWLTEFYPQSDKGEITGGVEARCFFVGRYLRRSDCKIEIIARKTSGEVWDTARIGSIPRRIIFLLGCIVRSILGDFDLIEGCNFITYPVAWLSGTIHRKPVVYWYADVYAGRWQEIAGRVTGNLMEIWEKVCLQLPGVHFVAISEETKRKLISQGVSPERVTVIYCGTDEEEIKTIRQSSRKMVDIICISRLLNYKRVDDLIRATEVLVNQGMRDIRVEIIGRGPEDDKLQSLTVSLGIERNIKFSGYLTNHEEVLRKISQAKVYCLPSVVEGFGITAIEAAGLKVPFVLADTIINEEIVGGSKAGMIFKAKDYIDLASKLKLLLTDKKTYQECSERGGLLAKKYFWKDIALKTYEYYEDLLNH